MSVLGSQVFGQALMDSCDLMLKLFGELEELVNHDRYSISGS